MRKEREAETACSEDLVSCSFAGLVSCRRMFLRQTIRNKDGKEHRYFSVVENRRVAGGRVVQRHVLYLGEINDTVRLCRPRQWGACWLALTLWQQLHLDRFLR
jgi:hypothetical protein